MQESLKHLYSMPEMTCVDCRFRSLHDVMKEVGRIVHLTEKYKAADIDGRMHEIERGEYDPPRDMLAPNDNKDDNKEEWS